jgi:hypothetical protein
VVCKLFFLKSKLLISSLLLGVIFSSFSSSIKSFLDSEQLTSFLPTSFLIYFPYLIEQLTSFLPTEKEMNQRAEKFLVSNNFESLVQKANERKKLSLKNNNLNQNKNDFSVQNSEIYGPNVVDKLGVWQFGLTFHLPLERMVRSSWSNFWLIDIVPLIMRKGILSILGQGDPGNTSQKTRDFIMGKTNEFAKGSNIGHKKKLNAIYWDRVIPWPIFLILQAALGELVLNQISKIWDGYKTWRNSVSEIIFSKKRVEIRVEIKNLETKISSLAESISNIEKESKVINNELINIRKNSTLTLKQQENIIKKLERELENKKTKNKRLNNEISENKINLLLLNYRFNKGKLNIIFNYLETAFNWLINNLKKFLSAPIIAMSYAVRLTGNIQLANNMYNHPYDYTDGILSYITELWENIKNIPVIGEALGFLIDNDLYTYVGVPLY